MKVQIGTHSFAYASIIIFQIFQKTITIMVITIMVTINDNSYFNMLILKFKAKIEILKNIYIVTSHVCTLWCFSLHDINFVTSQPKHLSSSDGFIWKCLRPSVFEKFIIFNEWLYRAFPGPRSWPMPSFLADALVMLVLTYDEPKELSLGHRFLWKTACSAKSIDINHGCRLKKVRKGAML